MNRMLDTSLVPGSPFLPLTLSFFALLVPFTIKPSVCICVCVFLTDYGNRIYYNTFCLYVSYLEFISRTGSGGTHLVEL